MDFATLPDALTYTIIGMLPSVYDALRLRCAYWPRLSNTPPTEVETELLGRLEAMPIKQSELLMRTERIRLGVDTLTRFRRNERKRREECKVESKRKEKKAKEKARREAKKLAGDSDSGVGQKPKKKPTHPQKKRKPTAKRAKRRPWDGQGVTVKKMDVVINSDFSDIGFAHA